MTTIGSCRADVGIVNPQQESEPALPKHRIESTETIGDIATKFGVSTQELLAANPQIHNPEALYPGEYLNIPAKATKDPASGDSIKVTDSDEVKTGDKKNGSSDKTEVSLGAGDDGVSIEGSSSQSQTSTDKHDRTRTTGTTANGGVTVDPNKGTVSVSAGGGFSESVKFSKGVGITFGFNSDATIVSGQNTKNGVTTFTASSDVSVGVELGFDAKQGSFEYGYTGGIKSSFEVSMPENAARTTYLAGVNPYDPASMPTGTVIKMDGSKYQTNEFKASFRHIAAELKLTDEKGASLLVEKTDNHKVRVTVGPTAAMKVYNALGVDFDAARIMLGRDDKLTNARLKTAEFDLSTIKGKAAYNDFVANGNMPVDNGNGVSGVKTVEKLDYSSQTKLDAKIGPVKLGMDGAKNTGNYVTTTHPDGSIERTAEIQYGNNLPMTLTQKFDKKGTEIISERRYAYTSKADENTVQMLNIAMTGDIGAARNGPVKAGDTVTISYTEQEMNTLRQNAAKAVEANQGMTNLRILTKDYNGNAVSTFDFAIRLARNLNGDSYGSAQRLFTISSGADGDLGDKHFVKLPGTLSVQHPS